MRDIDLSKYKEDEYGWYYWAVVNQFGHHFNPYDLSMRKNRHKYKKTKRYIKLK